MCGVLNYFKELNSYYLSIKKLFFMKKKIIVAGLLLLSGLFVGCLDNEELSGIEDLRKSKAEFIRAESALKLAEVATENASARIQLALAVREELTNAKKKQIDSLDVLIASASSEAQLAELNKVKQGHLDELEANNEAHKVAMLAALEATAKAEADYQNALELLAGQKDALSAAQQTELTNLIGKIKSNRDQYATQILEVAKAETKLMEAINNSVTGTNGAQATAERKIRGLQADIATYQAAILGLEEGITTATAKAALAKIALAEAEVALAAADKKAADKLAQATPQLAIEAEQTLIYDEQEAIIAAQGIIANTQAAIITENENAAAVLVTKIATSKANLVIHNKMVVDQTTLLTTATNGPLKAAIDALADKEAALAAAQTPSAIASATAAVATAKIKLVAEEKKVADIKILIVAAQTDIEKENGNLAADEPALETAYAAEAEARVIQDATVPVIEDATVKMNAAKVLRDEAKADIIAIGYPAAQAAAITAKNAVAGAQESLATVKNSIVTAQNLIIDKNAEIKAAEAEIKVQETILAEIAEGDAASTTDAEYAALIEAAQAELDGEKIHLAAIVDQFTKLNEDKTALMAAIIKTEA